MWAARRPSLAASSANWPRSKIVSPPSATRQGEPSSRSAASPRAPRSWPTLATTRPTFGSSPATAHLSSGPLTTPRPSARAASTVASPRTVTRSTWFVPSPLRTTWCASWPSTSPSAASKVASSHGGPTSDDATSTMSLVDSSPSTPTLPRLSAAARSSAACMAPRPPATRASVSTKQSIVPRFGSIMPAPLTTPTTDPPPGRSARAALA
mmetsp:Transcript_1815/g.5949  ORF Transcript_1815/g.5949 Transcript_1815/m.5949 type:complete len:210 (+) Transcript_1815:228-857(+)